MLPKTVFEHLVGAGRSFEIELVGDGAFATPTVGLLPDGQLRIGTVPTSSAATPFTSCRVRTVVFGQSVDGRHSLAGGQPVLRYGIDDLLRDPAGHHGTSLQGRDHGRPEPRLRRPRRRGGGRGPARHVPPRTAAPAALTRGSRDLRPQDAAARPARASDGQRRAPRGRAVVPRRLREAVRDSRAARGGRDGGRRRTRSTKRCPGPSGPRRSDRRAQIALDLPGVRLHGRPRLGTSDLSPGRTSSSLRIHACPFLGRRVIGELQPRQGDGPWAPTFHRTISNL